jgi:hypothetical protein
MREREREREKRKKVRENSAIQIASLRVCSFVKIN